MRDDLRIKDLTAQSIGQMVELTAILETVEISKTHENKDFAQIVLRDKEHTITGNIWDIDDDGKSFLNKLKQKVVLVNGLVKIYKEVEELRITSINPSDEPISIFVKTAPYASNDMAKQLVKYINLINNNDYKTIINALVQAYSNQLLTSKATTENNHDYYGGLLYHIVCVTRNSIKLCQDYPIVNQDLLIAASIIQGFSAIVKKEPELLTESQLLTDKVVEISVKGGLDYQSENMVLLRHLLAESTDNTLEIPESIILKAAVHVDSQMDVYNQAKEISKERAMPIKLYDLNSKEIYSNND
ncbi:hypothetical protein [Pseudolactococcus insecticola]|uniref:Putative CMP-binding factor n=1 Tax=Pseudolactococcus insecticola TaxID=2709158 RepID=A0A6A0B9M0_9LACT|nr:hypothetical protein [Lactococcus insecticola]GFH41415.1 putative CMP-binding factor [Lactococcus insecticola]